MTARYNRPGDEWRFAVKMSRNSSIVPWHVLWFRALFALSIPVFVYSTLAAAYGRLTWRLALAILCTCVAMAIISAGMEYLHRSRLRSRGGR